MQISDLDIKTNEFTALINHEFEPPYFDRMIKKSAKEMCSASFIADK